MSHDDIKEIMKRCVEDIKGENVMEIKQEDPLQDDHPVQEHVLENNDNENALNYEDNIDIDEHGMLSEIKEEEIIDLKNHDGYFEKIDVWDTNSEKQLIKCVKDEPSDEKDSESNKEENDDYETHWHDQFPKDEPPEGNDSDDEAHPGFCEPCQRSFKLVSHLTRHNREIHQQIPEGVCSNCGKSFTRKENLKVHEVKCLNKGKGAGVWGKGSFCCQYCPKKYSTKFRKVVHEKNCHREDGSLIVTEKISKEVENICKVCQIPKRFSNKKTLRRHMKRIHDGRDDIIKVSFSKNIVKLSESEVMSQNCKKADCELCSEVFACEQDLLDHMKAVHDVNRLYKCKQCTKQYSHRKYLKDHERSVHTDAKFVCPDCGKKLKHKQTILQHLERHRNSEFHGNEKPNRKRKPISSLGRSQRYARLKEEADKIK